MSLPSSSPPAAAEFSAEIERLVRQSRSNLALTLACLPKDRRCDMQLFYAFCRLVDDIADEPDHPLEQRRALLKRWRHVLEGLPRDACSPMEAAVLNLMQRRGIPASEMVEIVAGVSMDLDQHRYETWADLQLYCHRVAGCVGLVSLRIFGCTQPESRDYARHLGDALQMTNILRDVGQDWHNGRLYLPADDLAKFGVSEQAVAAGSRSANMLALLEFEADRAEKSFQSAVSCLTQEDRPRLVAAETMREIYQRVLAQMRADGFRIFEKRYRLSAITKLGLVGKAWVRGWLSRKS